MNKEKKIVLRGDFEDVIEFENHYYIQSKKDRVCVLPYTINEGLLDKIGVVEIWNDEEREKSLTLITDYLNADDETNLVGANRVFYSITGVNLTDASRWMYLGSLFNSLNSDSPIRVYCVNVTDIEIKEYVLDVETKKSFKFLDSARVTQTDDLLFLGAFNRLFNFFYTNSLK
jgi:hypothetical protein